MLYLAVFIIGCVSFSREGISYLSRAQESFVNFETGNLLLNGCSLQSPSALSVADSIFTERIKTRVKNWMNSCNNLHKTEGEQS